LLSGIVRITGIEKCDSNKTEEFGIVMKIKPCRFLNELEKSKGNSLVSLLLNARPLEF